MMRAAMWKKLCLPWDRIFVKLGIDARAVVDVMDHARILIGVRPPAVFLIPQTAS